MSFSPIEPPTAITPACTGRGDPDGLYIEGHLRRASEAERWVSRYV